MVRAVGVIVICWTYAAVATVPYVETQLAGHGLGQAPIFWMKTTATALWAFLVVFVFGFLIQHHERAQIEPYVKMAQTWEKLSKDLLEFEADWRRRTSGFSSPIDSTQEEFHRSMQLDSQRFSTQTEMAMAQFTVRFAADLRIASQEIIEQGLWSEKEARTLLDLQVTLVTLRSSAIRLGEMARLLAKKYNFELKQQS